MILTNKQAHFLLLILKESICKTIQAYFSIPLKDRLKLLNEIIDQRDNKKVDPG